MKNVSRLSNILIAQSAPAIITRRGFLVGSAAVAVAVAAPPLWAQSRNQGVRSVKGLVRINGEKVGKGAPVRPGDTVQTGPSGTVSFVVGGDAFFLRENSELSIDAPSVASALIGSLRMITGALGAVFAKRQSAQVILQTPTVTAGIRGTGCYTEARDEGTYFCTCFGAIQLQSDMGANQELVIASHHNARMILRDPKEGQTIIPSSVGNHTDQEMDGLEKLVGRRAPWVGTPDEGKPYPSGA